MSSYYSCRGSRSAGSQRTAADGNKVYCCSLCRRIEVANYDNWLFHLSLREHQDNMRKGSVGMSWRKYDDVRGRCVVVTGIEGIKALEMLDFLKMWGEIEDFSYKYYRAVDGGARHCLCLYRDRESAIACVAESGREWKGKRLVIHYQSRNFKDPEKPEQLKPKMYMEDSLYYGR